MITYFSQSSRSPVSHLIACFVLILAVGCAETKVEEETTSEPSGPVIHSQEFRYTVGDQEHVGYLAWDTTIQDKRPGILVVHEWWGHNDYTRKRARMLAELGYTAMALDMFGDGKTADHPDEAMAFVQQATENAGQAKDRFIKAMYILRAHPTVNEEHVAAIGYCFGGGVVLNMARAKVGLDGVVSFHGSLGSDISADSTMQTKVLVCTGGADPMVPDEAVEAFRQEMEAAGADYEIIVYPDATHAFTNPAADSLGQKFGMPVAYQPAADTASWEAATKFLDDLFGS